MSLPSESELHTFSREALLALVRDLVAQVQRLEAEVTRLKQPPPTSQNSSQPPSRDQKGNTPARKRPRKRGAQPGHVAAQRPLSDQPDKVLEVPVTHCQQCQADLQAVPATRTGTGADERCVVHAPVAVGQHLRDAGADLATGELALAAGTRLEARRLALLSALGATTVCVGMQPRVAVLSTGDELLALGAPLRPGAVRDSNGTMLAQMVEDAGGRCTTLAHLPDDPGSVERGLREALATHDVVLTIGGVSAGDFDPVKQAIERLDGLERWRVAMRPGRPQAFGRHGDALFFGLPGNPASVVCVFETLVRPALLALQGFREIGRASCRERV